MHRSIRATTSFPLACAALLASAAPAVAAPPPGEVSPEMVQRALGDLRKSLAAQCPAPRPRIAESAEANYPIHVDKWGKAGPRVILVHGGVQGRIGGGPETFDRQLPLSKKGWRLERLSRPGFGKSPSRGVDDMYADARAITGMITPGTNIVAHSWGGTEALLAAASAPEKIASFIIIEPAIGPMIGGPAPLANPAVVEDLKKRTIAQLAAKTPADSIRIFTSFMGDLSAEKTLAPGLQMTDEAAMEVGCNGLSARPASDADVQAALAKLKEHKVPVLVVTGGWSPMIDATGDAVARLAGGRHVVVKAPNHFVQYAGASEFNVVVDKFMRDAQRAKR